MREITFKAECACGCGVKFSGMLLNKGDRYFIACEEFISLLGANTIYETDYAHCAEVRADTIEYRIGEGEWQKL